MPVNISPRPSRRATPCPRPNAMRSTSAYGMRCSGQGKTDTTLSGSCTSFVFIGTDIPEIRMFAPTVIEHLNIVNNVITGFLTRQIIPLRRALALQAAKKPLRDCIVQTIPLSTHTARNTMLRQQCSVGMTGVLRTTVTMVEQPHVWLATTERHLQRGSHQWRIHMITHRPAHNLPRIQVQQHRGIQPSLLGPYVGDIATPHYIGR